LRCYKRGYYIKGACTHGADELLMVATEYTDTKKLYLLGIAGRRNLNGAQMLAWLEAK